MARIYQHTSNAAPKGEYYERRASWRNRAKNLSFAGIRKYHNFYQKQNAKNKNAENRIGDDVISRQQSIGVSSLLNEMAAHRNAYEEKRS